MSRPATVAEPILDGAALLYKRPRSSLWQVRFRVGREWYHRSTGEAQRSAALEKAQEMYFEAKYRNKLGMPVVSRTFASIAKAALADMHAQNDGKNATLLVYIRAIENVWIPFLGNYAINSIDTALLREHDQWRTQRMGRQPKLITVKNQNVALGRVFAKAVELKAIQQHEIPKFVTSGASTEARPGFSIEEYRALYRGMRTWVRAEGISKREADKRLLLRDMVLVIANTGMRPMNEVNSVTWAGVKPFVKDGVEYLSIFVDGKTGRRTLVARAAVAKFLERIRSRAHNIADDQRVFALPDGKVFHAPDELFKTLLRDLNLLVDPLTGVERTLYSLRHFYATQALLHNRVPILTLAKNMGTSVRMLERHYSKLTPMLAADQLA